MLALQGMFVSVLRRKMTWQVAAVVLSGLWACGEGVPSVFPALSLEKALVSPAEMLEYEPLPSRLLLWEELLSQAQEQTLRPSLVQPLFPFFSASGFVPQKGPAEPLPCLELPPEFEPPHLLVKLDERREAWSYTPQENWQGLSERDVARCLALTLLHQWNIQGEVNLQKVANSPYAAAYVEGSLRLNPTFVSLAAATFELIP